MVKLLKGSAITFSKLLMRVKVVVGAGPKIVVVTTGAIIVDTLRHVVGALRAVEPRSVTTNVSCLEVYMTTLRRTHVSVCLEDNWAETWAAEKKAAERDR